VTRATSSPQSTSTTRQTVNTSLATSVRNRRTTGDPRQPSSDDQSRRRHQSQTQAPISTDAAKAVVAGVTPANVDPVERVRHSSSTSAASASTTGHGPPSSAPSRQQHQRPTRPYSVPGQVPAELALPQRSSTANDVVVSRTARLTSAAPMTTNHDDVTPRQLNAAAAVAAAKPVTDDVDSHTPSERDVTPRHRHSAKQPRSRHSHSPDIKSSAARQTPSTPSPTAGMHQKSGNDTGSSKLAEGESSDAKKNLNTGQVARRLRRRRRQAAASPTGDVVNMEPRPSSGEDVDQSVSRRLTMPSVVHYSNVRSPTPPPVSRHRQLPSTPLAERPVSAVYVLSDGVRRRLVTADPGQPAPLHSHGPDVEPSIELVELAELPRRYRLEPAATSQRGGGSMMNVVGGGQRAAVWRREDVSVLSEQRREEIRRQKEADEQQTLVLRFGDIRVTSYVRLLIVRSTIQYADYVFILFNLLFTAFHSRMSVKHVYVLYRPVQETVCKRVTV